MEPSGRRFRKTSIAAVLLALTLVVPDAQARPRSGWYVRWIPSTATHWNPKTARVEPVPMAADDTALSRWICRARYRGSLAPGWHGIATGCEIEYGGAAIAIDRFELAVGWGHWMWAIRPGAIPTHAIAAGAEADGRPLYICRARVGRQTLVGKIRPGFSGCNFATGNHRVRTASTYEVLVSR